LKKIKSLFILLKKAQAVVQKTPRKNVTSTVLNSSSFPFFDGRRGWIYHNKLKRTALNQKKDETHAHRKELEAH
jgi:hypothetical protein